MNGSTSSDRFVVIGAGPAGLTAAWELAKRGYLPIVLEQCARVGGLARTESYRGFRFDLGGHRFFTKEASVLAVWQEVLGADFLTRPRLSRIYYDGKFFAYPLEPANALRGLGLVATLRVLLSYIRWHLFPHRPETTFEHWVTNRFGGYLFRTFFKAYTEKVWGVPCSELKAEWAAQRIKDLSLATAALNMFIRPRRTVKTLIEEFHYPRLGPGMMWEAMREAVERRGATVATEAEVVGVHREGRRVVGVEVARNGTREVIAGTHFISSMPLTELVARLDPPAPEAVRQAARALRYRDFLTVCLIVDRGDLFPDNWIYVHDPGVRVGRIQNFKNWSPDMVPDPTKTTLGLEYFCNAGDDLWDAPDEQLVALARREVEAIGLAPAAAVVDGCVMRVSKAYPIYDSAYADHVGVIRAFVDDLENLQTTGRNGLHRYDNQDHAMLTGMLAVRNAVDAESFDLWAVNTDAEYHEEIEADVPPPPEAAAVSTPSSRLASATVAVAAVLAGVALMWARQPAFFSEPRFWAEEGRVFFARAWAVPWWEALATAPLDYFTLYTNLAVGAAARLVPLEQAPLVTTLAALAVQALPLLFLAFAVAPEWGDGRRYIAMAIVLFASLSDEIWLTTLHSHYYFALVAFLVLLEPGDVGRARAAVYAALVAIAGLTGPVPCFLLPLFAYKYHRSRRAADAWQVAALGVATLVQVTVVAVALSGRYQGASDLLARGPSPVARWGATPDAPSPTALGSAAVPVIIWMKMIVLPIFGVDAAESVARSLEFVAKARGPVGALFAGGAAAGLFLLLGWLTRGLPPRLRWPIAGSYVLVAALSILLSFGNKGILFYSAAGSSRYAYVPGVLLLMLLLHAVRGVPGDQRPTARAVVTALLLAIALAGGAARYPDTLRWKASYPKWTAEVAEWRRDPTHALRVWPPGWTMQLSRRDGEDQAAP
jgi:protoporphyrinogen oxidase